MSSPGSWIRKIAHRPEAIERREAACRHADAPPALSEHERELTLILGDELVARRQELEDGDHDLTGLSHRSPCDLAQPVRGRGQGRRSTRAAAARASARSSLSLRSVGLRRESRPSGLDAASTLCLGTKCQLGLEPLGLRLEITTSFEGGNTRRRVVDSPLCQGNSGQTDLGLGQVFLKRQRLAVFLQGGLGIRALEQAAPRRPVTRPRWA